MLVISLHTTIKETTLSYFIVQETRLSKEVSGLPWWAQLLKLHTSNAEDTGSIPGQGTKSTHAAWHGQTNNFFFLKKRSQTLLTSHNTQKKDTSFLSMADINLKLPSVPMSSSIK